MIFWMGALQRDALQRGRQVTNLSKRSCLRVGSEPKQAEKF